MKQFLILPLGGLGKRFVSEGYKTYKPFLKISKKTRIIDNILNNFPKKNTNLIIIANQKKYKEISSNFKNKNVFFIKIRNHSLGPLFSLFLAREKIKGIIRNNDFFISYSDINWNWEFTSVRKFIKKKNVVVFSHIGFHPHLECDSNADFFLCNKKKELIKVSKKKPILKDYKKNYLAIGCYYFKTFKFFDDYFDNPNLKKFKKNKEFYLIDLLKNSLRNNNTINHFNIKKFVHLGVPNQYRNFLKWSNIFLSNFEKSLKLNYQTVMLMAGKGKRLKTLKEKKPFLKIRDYQIFDYILKKYGSKKNCIISNNENLRYIKKRYQTYKIQNSTSMLNTIEKSENLLKDKKKFFILSCDCFGIFQKSDFEKFLKKNNPDIVLFAFNISNLQRSMLNSHTSIEFKMNKIASINVKRFSKNKTELGHAGFFWIKSNQIFKNLQKFQKAKKIKREVLLDDYFKYLFDNRLCKVASYKLKDYIHIGSIKEYQEIKYWESYFDNEDR